MLDQYKKICESVADQLKLDWRSASVNELMNLYVKYENTDLNSANGCVAALMSKKWNAIPAYHSKSYSSAAPEDCFEWLTHAVLYALKNRKWLDPSSPMSRDKNGPDKILNRCIASTRNIFYQSANNDCRRINYNLMSIEGLQEDKEDYILPAMEGTPDDICNEWASDLIKDTFNNKDYLKSFIVDGIINSDVFTKKKTDKTATFNIRLLKKHLVSLDDKYCQLFSKAFGFDFAEVQSAANQIKSLSGIAIRNKMAKTFETLKWDILDYVDKDSVEEYCIG